jgi:hypothetical protein
MPRAIARIRRRFTGDVATTIDELLEETLVFGCPIVLGPTFSTLRFQSDWQREWDRWRDTILPKAIEHRPGLRPFAMYAAGEIAPRKLRKPAPRFGYTCVEVLNRGGFTVRHWLDLPAEYIEPEAAYLHRLGIVDDDELDRHVSWVAEANPDCDRCVVDHYPLEAALHT